jgi:hypothetical protein
VAVILRDSSAGQSELVAYVTVWDDNVGGTAGLRAFLRGKLPEHMIPATFQVIESMPVSGNGKVDRNALPRPVALESRQSGRGPRTQMEELMAGIWTQVLGVEDVGMTDNFFELGGHSLLATQVISRARKVMQVELPLRALFDDPTIAGLTQAVERNRELSPGWSAIERVSRDGPLPISYSQQRLWLANMLKRGDDAYNLSSLVCLNGSVNLTVLEHTLGEIERRHEVLRTSIQPSEDTWYQSINPARLFSLPIVDLSCLTQLDRLKEIKTLAAEESRRPFQITQGPLWRAAAMAVDEKEHWAIFTMHHIVSDAWSMQLLVKELTELYESFCAGGRSLLPELAIQYADYAAWQRSSLTAELTESQLAYWKRQLGGVTQLLDLPIDRPRPRVRDFRGASQSFTISGHVSEGLKALGREQSVTLFMVLLAAFQSLLHRYTGEDDIAVGSPVANRGRVETEDLIGFFVNTVVLRTNLSGNPTFKELLAQVRQTVLDAHAHQDVPFETVVEALRPERRSNYNPLFQMWFVLNHESSPAWKVIPGLDLIPHDIETETSLYDLILSMSEAESAIRGCLTYDVSLFDEQTAAQIIDCFMALLAVVAVDPDLPILDIPLSKDDEVPCTDRQPSSEIRAQLDIPFRF